MKRLKATSLVLSLLLCLFPVNSFGQRKNKVLTCQDRTFAVLKPLPELTYQCPADVANEYDDRILKSPERIKARESITSELAMFTDSGWWEASVEDLNVCDVRGKPGVLSAEENEKFRDTERQDSLLGNNQIRLVVAPDSCYQAYYNGANAFLLYRHQGRVYVTEVLDGYFSRAANSVSLNFLLVGGEQVIELETLNISGMRPVSTKHHFVIDSATKKAIPKKLSKKGKRWRLKN